MAIKNILSIDWSYFVKFDNYRYMLPDLSSDLFSNDKMNEIWLNYYKSGDVEKVKANKKLIAEVENFIAASISAPLAWIGEGQYEIDKCILEKFPDDTFNIVHIGYLHNCGILDETFEEKHVDGFNIFTYERRIGKLNRFVWVKNKDRDVTCSNDYMNDFIEIYTSVEDIKKTGITEWDCIFLCRRDVFSPPHLDKQFLELYHFINRHTKECLAYDYINEYDRYKVLSDELKAFYIGAYKEGNIVFSKDRGNPKYFPKEVQERLKKEEYVIGGKK